MSSASRPLLSYFILALQISSARMGFDPATSVVAVELRVHGIQGLHDGDGSELTTPVTGHPCAVIVAIAEKAADLIKGNHST